VLPIRQALLSVEQLQETRHHGEIVPDPVGDHACIHRGVLVGAVFAGQVVDRQTEPLDFIGGIIYAGLPPGERSISVTSRDTERLVSSTMGTSFSTIACQR